MENKTSYVVIWKPVTGGTASSYITYDENDAIETFKNNVRLGFRVCIEVMR